MASPDVDRIDTTIRALALAPPDGATIEVGADVLRVKDAGIAAAKIAAGAAASNVGTLGGDLTGSLPNPTVAANAVTTTKIADGAVTLAKLAATFLRCIAKVTIGSPGSVAVVGSASGISGVSIQTVNAFRCVRFAFATAMPDTDYVVAATEDQSAGFAGFTSRQLTIFSKATTYVDVGWMCTGIESFDHIDQWTHQFNLLVYR